MDDSAPRPAERSKRQRFFDFLLMLVTMVPAIVAGVFASDALSRRLCPQSAFLWGTAMPSLRLVAIVLFGFAGGYLLVRALLRMFPALVRLTGYPQRYGRASGAGSWSRFWLYFAGAWTLVGLLLTLGLSVAEFCLTQDAISFRPSPWDETRVYDWQDVAAIQTSCSRGTRGRWNAAYLLILQDGTAIDLLGSEPHFRDGYPALAHALHGRDLPFDASGVVADCGHSEVDLFRHALR